MVVAVVVTRGKKFTRTKRRGRCSLSLGVIGELTGLDRCSLFLFVRGPSFSYVVLLDRSSLPFLPDAPHFSENSSYICRQETDAQFRLAIGSYVEQYSNCVQIIKKKPAPKNPSDPTYSYENQCYVAAEFDHPYPCTKILWSPDVSSGARDLLATSGDYLRLWSMSDDGLGAGTLTAKREALLNNVS